MKKDGQAILFRMCRFTALDEFRYAPATRPDPSATVPLGAALAGGRRAANTALLPPKGRLSRLKKPTGKLRHCAGGT